MEAKIHKDVVLFKRILTHDKFDDHVEQIHFSNVICLTGLKIGAAPGTGSLTDVPHVHIFAQDLHTLSGSRYACAAEHCTLPDSGTRSVRVEPVFTKKLLLRGQYQTLPLAVYGWAMPGASGLKDTPEVAEAASIQLATVVEAHAASTSPASILPPPLPFTPPFLSLPANATQALQSLLPRWASVRTFEQAMRFQSLDKAQLQAILTAAENICQAAARKTPLVRTDAQHHAAATASSATADIKEEPEVDLVGNSTLTGISDGMFMDLDERLDSLPAGEHQAEADQKDEAVNETAIGECAAYMAAEWCGVLGGAYASSAAADFGLAGLAAAVVVASCPRHASHFIAAQGMLALASVLSLLRPPKSVVRFAITAAELLTRSAGAYACEAALGWIEPAELSDEVVQAAQATAASLGARQRRATPQGTPGDPPHGASHSNVSRERPSRQGQTDHRAPQAAKPAEASVQDTKPGLHHRRARQDSRQASGDGKQSEAGSDQEGEPLVQYQDEGQPQYSNGYHGGEPEGQEYEAEGSVLQDAQQYEDEEGGQQYGSEDEQQAEAQAEDDEQQFEEEVQGVGGPSGRRSGSVGSAQDNAPDEWDIPAEEEDKLDEMEAETPEHLSELEQGDGQQDAPDQAGGNTSKPSSPHAVTAEVNDQPPTSSEGKVRHRREQRSSSRHSDEKPVGDEAASGIAEGQEAAEAKDEAPGSSEKPKRSESGKESKRSRSDKEKRRRHSRDRHRSRERSRDRDADRDRRHRERKSRSKRSRSGDRDSERPKRSRHERSHPPREGPSTDKQHAGVEEREGASTAVTPTPVFVPKPQPKGLVVVKAKKFDGCYSQLVDAMLDSQPRQVVATGTTLLARLKLYAITAQATETAEQLVKAHVGPASQMGMQQVSKLINILSTHLVDLSEELLRSDSPAPATTAAALARKQEGHLPEVVGPDPCTVTALASRQLLELLAAVLHVPSLHAAHVTATPALAAQIKGPQVEAALMQPLLAGCKALLSVLLSTPSGLAYVVQQQEGSQSLISALQNRSTGGRASAFALAETLGAVTALQQVCQEGDPLAMVRGPAGPSAPGATPQEILQILCEQSITAAGRKAVGVAIAAVPGALQRLMTLMQASLLLIKPASSVVSYSAVLKPKLVKREDARSARAQPMFDLSSMCAAQLLLEFVGDSHPRMLHCWAAHAADLDKLAAAALAATSMARMRHTLQALQARAQAAMALAEGGAASLVQTLTGLLPPLANSDVKGVFVVEADAAAQFMHDVSKANTAEAGLHLLAAVLSQPSASRDAVIATEANALQALERALRTGTVLLGASQADTMWSFNCGDAIEDVKMAVNRWQVLNFVTAASNAIRALFARLQQRTALLKSISLLDCLLGAHAALVCTSESLGASMGNAGGPETQQVLQARQALTGALKIWWDQSQLHSKDNIPDWQPALLPAMFVGAKAAAAAMESSARPIQAPGKLYHRICVISDILPSEWPPVQTRKGVPHPPPTLKAYRVALAHGLEPVKEGFKDMLNVAVASDSRMFRAALVRLVARAAGLGGGMGILLAHPITEALKDALSAHAALAEVRRVLEIIVPLAYRPPIKAAFLDLRLADTLGQLLGRLVPVLGQGADAGSLCTMVLEAILTLQDPENCLNPMAPAAQRVPDETPTPAEGGLIAAIIMASLSRLGGNAHVAKRILKLLSTHLPGRVVLRLGAAKWQAQATGGEYASATGSKASLQWAASRLWAAAEAGGADPKLRSTNQEVAQLLEQVAALGEDVGEADLTPPSNHASQRFAAAVKAAVAADVRTKASETNDFSETANPMTQLFDPASHTFWRNVKERAVAPVTAFGRNPERWINWEPSAVPPVPSWLPGPLTPAKRPREARLGGGSQAGSSLASPSQRLKTEPSSGSGSAAATGAAAAAKAGGGGAMPGDDLPPVIAPPGRSRAQQMRGRIGGNSSRPASLHVDDFEKAASSMPTPPPVSATPKATLPPSSLAPPLSITSNKSGSMTPRESGTPRSTSFTPRASAGPTSLTLPNPSTPAAPSSSPAPAQPQASLPSPKQAPLKAPEIKQEAFTQAAPHHRSSPALPAPPSTTPPYLTPTAKPAALHSAEAPVQPAAASEPAATPTVSAAPAAVPAHTTPPASSEAPAVPGPASRANPLQPAVTSAALSPPPRSALIGPAAATPSHQDTVPVPAASISADAAPPAATPAAPAPASIATTPVPTPVATPPADPLQPAPTTSLLADPEPAAGTRESMLGQEATQASTARSTQALQPAGTSAPALRRLPAVSNSAAQQQPAVLALPAEPSPPQPSASPTPLASQAATGMSHRDPRRSQAAAAPAAAQLASSGKAAAAQTAPTLVSGTGERDSRQGSAAGGRQAPSRAPAASSDGGRAPVQAAAPALSATQQPQIPALMNVRASTACENLFEHF
ncbi:hypothetical protein ABBQ32_000252 [Trebouxia sp. C0010 RCD-2024]